MLREVAFSGGPREPFNSFRLDGDAHPERRLDVEGIVTFPVRVAPPREDVMESRHPSEGFASFDRLLSAPRPGALVVRTREEDREPILAHASRRLRAAGFRVVDVLVRQPGSVFREAATQLGLGALTCHVGTYASAMSSAGQRIAIVAPMPTEGSWDDGVARKLGELGEVVLVLVTTVPASSWAERSIDVTAALTLEEKRLWMEAVARDGETLLRHRDLHDLETWWRHVRRESGPLPFASVTASKQASPRLVSARALETAIVVALARRSIPITALQRSCGDAALVDEVVATGLVVERGRAIVIAESVDGPALEALATPELRDRAVAMLLDDGFALDPWASARAAELLVGGRPLDADAAMDRAARYARDARITGELAGRWRTTLDGIGGEVGTELRIRAAERALGAGKPLDALRWCDGIVDARGRPSRVQLAVARAHVQLGDLVSARLVLDRIGEDADDDELRATIAVECGEIGYLTGDHEAARNEAETALRLSAVFATRLAARSILGKLLLARGEWDAADGHFAADAIAAQNAGDATAALRARLNRAIALGSKGFLDEARQTLVRVLEDAERGGEHRAIALALSNLGFVAYRQRDFMGALRYWEERLNHCDSLGGRASAALPIANLAELRLMLGLVESAEHAVRFGRKIMAGSLTPARAAHLERVAAEVALARGATELAEGEVQSSLVHARASGEVQYVGDAAVVGAKIALADGAVQRVDGWLRLAEENAKTARTVADIAFLRAMQLRALGRPELEAGQRALELARSTDDYDLIIQVHVLVAATARDQDDLELARLHATRAVELRDRIAASLTPGVLASFLAKPEMRSLAELIASLGATRPDANVAEPRSEPQPRSPRSAEARGRVLVGADRRMRSLEAAIQKVALSDSTILVQGESGTGKELVARALHLASRRASGPLVVVNCAALVETLLLSELFGHEKGAFTGASGRRRGRFELAEGGTLFLDEIGDISPRTQVALLRVLQDKTFERVGGTATLTSNARVICATHRDLHRMVERGEFREDLYYRICQITLEVPPLRARLGDIPLLADHLLGRISEEHGAPRKRLTNAALARLQEHHWPGNVRELENVLRAATVFAEGTTIVAADLVELRKPSDDPEAAPPSAPSSGHAPPSAPSSRPAAPSAADAAAAGVGSTFDPTPSPAVSAYEHVRAHGMSLHDLKRQIERECVTRALRDSSGNITRAAELLGMKRPRVSQLVKHYGLVLPNGATEDEE